MNAVVGIAGNAFGPLSVAIDHVLVKTKLMNAFANLVVATERYGCACNRL